MLSPWCVWKRDRARRSRGRDGERKVAVALDQLAALHRAKARHSVPLHTRDGRRGDLDHALVVRRGLWPRPRLIVAVETKAERPHPSHLDQARANAERASRRHFGGAPQYRLVVHPNSGEPVTFDAATGVARLGLPQLAAYVDALLAGDHPERLMR